MEEIVSNYQSRRQSSIPLHHSSHSISKLTPNIRIVHLIAPEIIKTDVTNFRDLVQKLTGKPTANKKRSKRSTNSNSKMKVHQEDASINNKVKEENFVKFENQWINMKESPIGGYLSYLEEEEGEVEGFFQSTTNRKRSKRSKNSNSKMKVHQEDANINNKVKGENFLNVEDQWANMEESPSGGYLSYLEEEEGEVEGFFQPSFIGDLSSLFHVSS